MKRYRQKLIETFEHKEKVYDREVDLKSGKVFWFIIEGIRADRREIQTELYLELETQYELSFGVC